MISSRSSFSSRIVILLSLACGSCSQPRNSPSENGEETSVSIRERFVLAPQIPNISAAVASHSSSFREWLYRHGNECVRFLDDEREMAKLLRAQRESVAFLKLADRLAIGKQDLELLRTAYFEPSQSNVGLKKEFDKFYPEGDRIVLEQMQSFYEIATSLKAHLSRLDPFIDQATFADSDSRFNRIFVEGPFAFVSKDETLIVSDVHATHQRLTGEFLQPSISFGAALSSKTNRNFGQLHITVDGNGWGPNVNSAFLQIGKWYAKAGTVEEVALTKQSSQIGTWGETLAYTYQGAAMCSVAGERSDLARAFWEARHHLLLRGHLSGLESPENLAASYVEALLIVNDRDFSKVWNYLKNNRPSKDDSLWTTPVVEIQRQKLTDDFERLAAAIIRDERFVLLNDGADELILRLASNREKWWLRPIK